MNKTAAIIAAGIGGTFMTLQLMFPQQMSGMLFGVMLDDFMAGDHARARAAVYKVLIDPQSASFQDVHTVEAEKAKFVCGKVNSKDSAGVYAGHRAFVYERAGEVVRIDDDGRIAKIQTSFRSCPVLEETPPAPQVITIPPEAMAMAGKILKALPAVEAVTPAAAVALGGGASAGAAGSGSIQSGVQSLSQSVPQLDRKPAGQGGANAETPAKPVIETARQNERDWRGDRPPGAWPVFAADDPLATSAKPASKRSNADAIALALDLERRWTNFEAKRAKTKPSQSETREALRALLTIDPASAEFPQAWKLFVHLRQIDREAAHKNAAG